MTYFYKLCKTYFIRYTIKNDYVSSNYFLQYLWFMTKETQPLKKYLVYLPKAI